MTTVRTEIRDFKFLIWERLSLTVVEGNREGIYSCRISDIERDRLVISRPEHERGDAILENNRTVTVFCTRSDAAYGFRARVREARPKSPDFMYLLDLGDIQRMQRRRFVRIHTTIPVHYTVLPRPLREPIDPKILPMTAAHTLDLSAGGMLVAVSNSITTEDLLLIGFDSPGSLHLPRYILAACRYAGINDDKQPVAGVEFILNEDLPKHLNQSEMMLIPCEATAFDDRMQNALVSDISNEQPVVSRKGLL